MEEMALLTAMAAAVVVCAIPLMLADLVGMTLGLGWGYYSKKLKAKWRNARRTNDG
jgi:hypothetical protein